jgi:hypothetical protein
MCSVSRGASISKALGITDCYLSYNEIPAAKKAWITIKAMQQGKDPKMVHAGIKAHYRKIYNQVCDEIFGAKADLTKKLKRQ